MPRILIETEGGGGLGLGHVYRSIALATALRCSGAEVALDVDGDHAARELAGDAGFAPLPLTRYGPLDTSLRSADVLVRDRRTYKPLTPYHHYLVDIVDEPEDAPGDHGAVFASFDGPPFAHAVIRDAFRGAHQVEQVYNGVLVCLGGVDPTGSTQAIVDGLKAMDLDVLGIVGPGSANRQGFFASRTIWTAMALAPVVVASGGMTVLESACMGKPVFAVSHNDREERRMMRLASKVPWVKYCGRAAAGASSNLGSAIWSVLMAPEQRFALGARASFDVDGLGASRVATKILDICRNEAQAEAG